MKKTYLAPKVGRLLDMDFNLLGASIRTDGAQTSFGNAANGTSGESADSRRGSFWDDTE